MENQKSTSGFTGHPEPSSTTGSTKTINNSVSTGLAAVPSKNTTSTTTAATTNSDTHSIHNNTNPSNEKSVPPSVVNVASESATAETDEEAIRNRKLVEEFQYLLEKSQSLFGGLRDLPPTGSHRQWRPYFEKTFEVYTKLWKFQQQHRSVLENKVNYGLKRWEVGEIASKIGQLYYHYYLRTSETNYLHESYVFYEAIHERQYFKDILEDKNSALMIKKMRYYARFIIVCLLLNKDGNVRQFIGELEGLIEEYTKNFKPPDAKEWQMVLDEISTFTEAEKKIVPINLDRTSDKITHRVSSAVKERDLGPGIQKLKLQEAILVGNYQKQIKFSELTLDMYRMLQSLEREPFASHPLAKNNESSHQNEKKDANVPGAKEDQQQSQQQTTTTRPTATQITTSGAAGQVNQSERFGKRSNPHKYLLYRPSLSQLMVYISTAFKDTSDGCALLLYLSADGCAYPDQTVPGYGHGVVTTQRNKPNPSTDRTTTANAVAVSAAAVSGTGAQALTVATEVPVTPSVHCLCPGDLIPFTRKPLFLIVDSDHSTGFKNIPNVFDQPVMCLMSPTEYPSSVQDKSEIGSLFTLFLHTPLLGFCSVSDIGNLDQDDWDQCVKKIADMETMIGDMLIADPAFDTGLKRFMTDDFLCNFIVRFVLCSVILRFHSSFKDEKTFPTSYPPLPENIYTSPEIVKMLCELTEIADVGTYFSLPSYATTPPAVMPTPMDIS